MKEKKKRTMSEYFDIGLANGALLMDASNLGTKVKVGDKELTELDNLENKDRKRLTLINYGFDDININGKDFNLHKIISQNTLEYGCLYNQISIQDFENNKFTTEQLAGEYLMRLIVAEVSINFIDEYWKKHLRNIDDLKKSVQNAYYEQKDPLLIFKFESFSIEFPFTSFSFKFFSVLSLIVLEF